MTIQSDSINKLIHSINSVVTKQNSPRILRKSNIKEIGIWTYSILSKSVQKEDENNNFTCC